jgi:hypothetical protein
VYFNYFFFAATTLFNLLAKYRPESRIQKTQRLKKQAEEVAAPAGAAGLFSEIKKTLILLICCRRW